MLKVFTPPQQTNGATGRRIFLAGSIEMGKAVEWQASVIEYFNRIKLHGDVSIFNPRRPDWDSSWEQKFTNPHFYQQVMWEMDNIEKADYVLFYFQEGTVSPVSMLELGFCNPRKAVVVCPEGFHRKGNIDIFCEREDIKQFSMTDALLHLSRNL